MALPVHFYDFWGATLFVLICDSFSLAKTTIDPEFRDIIPPLMDEERRMLEDSIVANGCETPLTVWNNTIVDGHNRYDICQEHGIPFAIMEKEFENRDEALMWMISTQLGRRNLTTYQKGVLALKFEPLLREQAKERQATSTGGNNPRLVQNSSQAGEGEKTRQKLAEAADEETKRKRIRSWPCGIMASPAWPLSKFRKVSA